MVNPKEFHIEQLQVSYDRKQVLHNVTLDLGAEGVTVIVGANGSGKSTLLRTLARVLEPDAGSVSLGGTVLKHIPARTFAQTVGFLPQTPHAPEGMSVAELIDLGRTPHRNWFGRRTAQDDESVARVVEQMNLTQVLHEPLEALSGGQRQRAWIAMVLVKEPQVLLFDEPTTYLDVSRQLETLDLLEHLAKVEQKTVIMVLHELNIACRYANRLVALHKGKIAAVGAPRQVVTSQFLREVFDLDAVVIPDPVSGTPLVVPARAGE